MKNLTTILIVFLFAFLGNLNYTFAQAPEGIIYQAEARDSRGIILPNATLDVKITILEDEMEGSLVWEGLHTVTTNNYGMFVLVIGEGTSSYNFTTIDWGNHAHFLNVEVKSSKGKNALDWVDMGTTQLLSVPYALHAKTAGNVLAEETDPVFIGSEAANITTADIANLGNLSGVNNGDQSSADFDHDALVNTHNLTSDIDHDQLTNFETSEHFIQSEISIPASQIFDFDTEVSNNTSVEASTTHSGQINNPHAVTKTQVGLGHADNTSDADKPVSTATQLALNLKVDSNLPINGRTKTKITYDNKGLVTGGTDATTADINASTDKNYVTDDQQTVLEHTSGTNTGDQDWTTLPGIPAAFADGVDNVDDADADPNNEIELPDQLGQTGKTLTTNGTSPGWSFTSFNDLTNIPNGLIDGDDDRQLTETEVDAMVANNGFQQIAADGDVDATNELQTISVNDHELTISDGNTIPLPDNVNDADADPTNEIQTLSIDNDIISLTNGGSLQLPVSVTGDDADADPTNEIQTLSIDNNTLSLTDGGSVQLPASTTNLDDAYNNGATITADVGAFFVNGTDGIISTGTINSGADLPVSGEGTRLIWYPKKGAFRAGYVEDTQWDDDIMGVFSTALGHSTTASGYSSSAFGFLTTASGDYSTAMGAETTAIGLYSTALGSFTIANGNFSTALGFYTTASGENSTAMGVATTASGKYSIALGSGTTSSGFTSTAFGAGTTASGDASTSFGLGTTASEDLCTAFGLGTTARGYNSTSMGYCTTASGEYSTAMGTYAEASGKHSFAMGDNTIASGNDSYAIGFQTVASGHFSTAMGNNVSTDSKSGSFVIGDDSFKFMYCQAENRMQMRFDNGYYLYTSADLSTAIYTEHGWNQWHSISDSTKKTNYVKADGEYFLESISKLRLGSWNYKSQSPKEFRHYGPMAQEIFYYFGKDKFGTIGEDVSLGTADMDGIMMIALQALEKRTTELKAKNAELEKRNKELAGQLIEIKNQFETKIASIEKALGIITEYDRAELISKEE